MFIKGIKFPKSSPFYNKRKQITFGNNQSNIIDFYLKTNKESNETGLNPNIQINCLLGDNGTGKSSFIKEIFEFSTDGEYGGKKLYLTNGMVFSTKSSKHQKINPEAGDFIYQSVSPRLDEYNTKIIVDDFWIGSKLFQESINKNSLISMSQKYGDAKMIINIFNFLKGNTKNSNLFANFLNLNTKFGYKLIVKARIQKSIRLSTTFPGFDDGKNEGYLRDGIFSLINIYLGRMDRFKSIISYENLNLILISLFDLVFLYVTDCRHSIFDKNNSGTKSKKINKKGLNNFIDSLNLVMGLLNFLKNDLGKNFKAGIFQEVKSGLLEGFIIKLGSLLKIFEEYSYGNYEIADQLFKSYKEKYSNNKLGYILSVDEFLKLSDEFIYDYVFQEDIPKANLNYYFQELSKNIWMDFKKKDKIFEYDGSQLDLDFPFLNLGDYFDLDINFEDTKGKVLKNYGSLSGGEKSILTRFSNIYSNIHDSCMLNYRNFIILIDEPDLHLHLDWQRQYIQKLVDVFTSIGYPDLNLHFIISTHSPFIVSDLPGENIIRIKKDSNGVITFQKYGEGEGNNKTSFGANYIDIIQEGFFNNRFLMGSLAEEVITNLSIAEKIFLSKELLGDDYKNNEKYKKIEDYIKDGNKKISELKEQIGDSFLKNYLLYFKTNENN